MLCEKCKNKLIIGGSAFTNYICEYCHNEKTYGMTCVPKICKECSEKNKKCERCLEKLDMEEIENYFFEKGNNRFTFFRLWNLKTKEMIYHDDNYYLTLDGNLFNKKNNFLNGIKRMEFSGFFDGNGKRIFEGDYIKQGKIEGLVIFIENQFKILLKTKTIKINEKKIKFITGNLFEGKINKKEI